MRATILAAAILASVAPPAAAGPWPRGEGRTFAALSYEMTVDLNDPLYALNHEALLYAERGLTERLTFVLDGAADVTDDDRSFIALLSWALAAPGATHQVSVAGGLGTRSDGGRSASFPVLAASWGRGFETRWGGGWTTAEAQYRAADGPDALAKLDLTLGLRPSDRSLVFGQLRLADAPGGDPTAQLTATMVLDIRGPLKAEIGLLYGLRNDDTAGLRSGLWLDF